MGNSAEDFSLFLPLLKVDEEQRLVYGIMAEEVLDNSGEIFDYESSKPLFEKWSDHAFDTSGGKSKGNVRTMHGSIAAGKLTDIGFNDDAKRIECCAKVVDENEWNKVLEGVYTGFSIGGRYAKRWIEKSEDGDKSTRYTADPVEVSLVDKPCIPTATFQMIKKDGMVENRLFKTVLGDDTMTDYIPTNDELIVKATAMAKAAGKTDADWLDFSEAASEALIDAHLGKASKAKKEDGEPLDGEDREKAIAETAGADEESPDSESKEQAKEEEEDEAVKADMVDDADEDEDEDEDAKAKKAKTAKSEEKKAYGKSDQPELEQVWKTSDGKTFVKKGDALVHQKSITDPSLPDLVKKAADKVAVLKADTGEKPEGAYGDVKYADPGYLSDDKPRYPLDTEQHIRSSWSYISKADTAAQYSADDLKRVKNRVATAWKDKINEAGPPSVEKMTAFGDLTKAVELTTGEGPLAKGLYEVGMMAHILQDVACVQACLNYEAEYEGDGSQIPAKLKDAAASLAMIMIEMVTEEVGELVENMKVSNAEVEVEEMLTMAAGSAGMEKADFAKAVEISGRDKSRIQKVHDHSIAMGAKCAKMDDTAGASENAEFAAEKMAKADMADKLESENEMLKADLASQRSEMEEAKVMLKSLMADIEMIKATPMPSAPRTTMVVDKSADFGKMEAAASEMDLSKMTHDQLADLAIRISQKAGRSLL